MTSPQHSAKPTAAILNISFLSVRSCDRRPWFSMNQCDNRTSRYAMESPPCATLCHYTCCSPPSAARLRSEKPTGSSWHGAARPPAAAAAAVVDDQCLRDQLRHVRHELQQCLCRHRTDHRRRRRWEQRTVQPDLYDAATGLQAGLQQSIARTWKPGWTSAGKGTLQAARGQRPGPPHPIVRLEGGNLVPKAFRERYVVPAVQQPH